MGRLAYFTYTDKERTRTRVTQFSPVTNEGREAETEQAETIARVLHSNTENSCQATFHGGIAEGRTERCKGLERFRESTPEVRVRRWAGEAVRGMTVVQRHTLEGGMACVRGCE